MHIDATTPRRPPLSIFPPLLHYRVASVLSTISHHRVMVHVPHLVARRYFRSFLPVSKRKPATYDMLQRACNYHRKTWHSAQGGGETEGTAQGGAAVREYDKVKFKCLQKKPREKEREGENKRGRRNNKLGQAKDTNVSTDAILSALQVATLAASPPPPPPSFSHSFYAASPF